MSKRESTFSIRPGSLPFFVIWATLAIIFSLGTNTVSAQNTLEPITIQLRWFHQFQFAGYYAATYKGFYADEGLNVTLQEFDPNVDRIDQMLAGKTEYGVGDPAILELRYRGIPVVVLAQIFQHSPQVLISKRKNDIFSPDDLVGKKVMLSIDQIGSTPIRAMILGAHGTMDGITGVPHEFSFERLLDDDVDAMSGYLSNEPFQLKKMGIAVNVMDPRSYGIDFYGDNLFTLEKEIAAHPERVEKIIRATIKGWAYALEHKDEIIDLIHTRYNPEKDLDMLRYEAKIIDQMVMPDLVPIGTINPKRYVRIAETYHRLGLTASPKVPDGFLYLKASEKRVLPRGGEKTRLAANKEIPLTDKERAWLEHNHTVRVFSTDHQPLMTFIEEKPVGISVDLLNEVAKHTGIHFEIDPPKLEFNLALEGLKKHDGPDVIAGLNPSPEREKGILFTKPYLSSPKFVFTRDDAPFVHSMGNLAGKTVAVIDGYLTHQLLARDHPDIDLLTYKSNKAALEAVSSGKAFAFIGSLLATSSMINKFGLTNLKAACPSSLPDATVGMAVRSDWPELRDIMNKVFDALPFSEKTAIINRWASVKIDYGISPGQLRKLIVTITGGILLVITLFWLWNRSLARKVGERTVELETTNKDLEDEVVRRTQTERLLQENTTYLESLMDSLPDAVLSMKMPERIIEWVHDKTGVLGYTPEECIGRTTAFLYPNRKDYQFVKHTIDAAITRGDAIASIEHELRRKNSEFFLAQIKLSFFRIDEHLVRITAIVRDITKRKLAEEALKKSEKTLKEAQRIAQLGNWELDISADRLIWSDEIYRIFEVDRKHFAASYEAFLNLVHPEDRNMVDDAYTQSLATRQPYALTHRLRMSDGRVKYVHEQCETIYDSEGKPSRSIGTVQDITALKQKEHDLERHQRHLKALAHQLTLAEEKERRAIAADLHDHIGHWLALARLQIKNMQTSKSALEKSVLIKDISNILMAAFTGTRKLISELSAPSMNEIGLGAAIAEFLEEQLAKRHGLATEFVDQFSNRHGKVLDDDQRAMLFRNVRELLVNVVKHAQATKVSVMLSDEAEMLKITVADDGIGFDPALSSMKNEKAAGFGLFSIQERVDDLGGSFDVQTEPGKGCRATLTIPLERIKGLKAVETRSEAE